MANPTFIQWRSNSADNSGLGLIKDDVLMRQLKCLAAYVSGQNPDGSSR